MPVETEVIDGVERTFFVDESTGGRKEVKLARFDLIPVGPLTALAEHYGRGALKYEDRNWEKGYPWSLSYAALLRHLTAWWEGEDDDPETGSSHLAAVAWHAFALLEFIESHPEKDNRPNTESDEVLPELGDLTQLVGTVYTPDPRKEFLMNPMPFVGSRDGFWDEGQEDYLLSGERDDD